MTTTELPGIHPEELKELEQAAGHKFTNLAEAHAYRRQKLDQDAAYEYAYGDKRERI